MPIMSRAVLGPRATSQKFDQLNSLSTAGAKALADGTAAIYVWGLITYKDAFGTDRFTNYRYMIGGNVGVRGVFLAQCENGNEAN